jgi:hypothetical protein
MQIIISEKFCVTYLNFSDFQTILVKTQQASNLPSPNRIAERATRSNKMASVLARTARKLTTNDSSDNTTKLDLPLLGQIYSGSQSRYAFKRSYPFLEYASKYWLLHTSRFKQSDSQTWPKWKHMISGTHHQGQTPWSPVAYEQNECSILDWAIDNKHIALFRHMILSADFINGQGADNVLGAAIRSKHSEFLDVGLECENLRSSFGFALQLAAELGKPNIVEKLLQAGVDANAANGYNEPTALQAAAEGGHLDVVEMLLAAGAEVNARPGITERTALQAAAGSGHLDVVERLLAAGGRSTCDAGICNTNSIAGSCQKWPSRRRREATRCWSHASEVET